MANIGSPNQQWRITAEGLIKSRLNDFVVDIRVPCGPWNSADILSANGVSGTPNQQWELMPVPEILISD